MAVWHNLFGERLGANNLFDSHGTQNCAYDVYIVGELLADLGAEGVFGDFDVFTHIATVLHQGEEVVSRDVHELQKTTKLLMNALSINNNINI